MNTPAHAVVNLAVLGDRAGPGTARAVFLGAVLPDLPIFLFYANEKLHLGVSESVVWSHDYFVSSWQPTIDALHSFPLILIAFALAWAGKSTRGVALSASLLLHSLGDFPLHHDDAHRHFFPFSDARFASPVSYWDPRYHGALGAAIEVVAVAAACAALARRHPSPWARALLVLLTAGYAWGYAAFYLR